jgi:hypothetical protein
VMLLFFTLIFLLNELQPIFMLYTSQGFVIENSNNVHIDGLTFVDSPQMHIAFERSTWVHATSLTIQAPKDSPNTDGIHIQHSQNIIIDNIRIGTGISFMEYSFFICFIIVFSFSFSFLNEYIWIFVLSIYKCLYGLSFPIFKKKKKKVFFVLYFLSMLLHKFFKNPHIFSSSF